MDSSDSTLSSLGGSSEANSMTQALKDLLKLNIAGSASIGSNANGTANPAMPIQSHSLPAGVGLDSASSSASGSINLRIKQNLMSSTNSASASGGFKLKYFFKYFVNLSYKYKVKLPGTKWSLA